MSHLLTVSGKIFTPVNPDVNQMDITDIAHALAMLCRANGHFQIFYSVAQHSVNCAKEAKCRGYSSRIQFACLLHDASGAYLSDVTRPVKQFLPQYREIENRLQAVVWEKWLGGPLTLEESQQVKKIDDALLYQEFFFFMNESVFDTPREVVSKPDFSEHRISEIKAQFLELFYKLLYQSRLK